VLWQVGAVGDKGHGGSPGNNPYRQILLERLTKDYPLSHKVVLYRAATLPIHAPSIQRIALGKLADANIDAADTLVIPPARKLDPDVKTLRRLARLDRAKA